MKKGLRLMVDGLWNHLPKVCVLVSVLVLAFSSCDRRDIYEDEGLAAAVVVSIDWRNLGGLPEGATIMLYPESGATPYTFTTNSVSRTIVQVPVGYYTVLVFNRTVDEFSGMHFAKMDSLGTAQTVLDFRSSWAGTADSVGYTVYEPEKIVCGRTDHFYVREIGASMIHKHPNTRAASDDTASDATAETLVPDTCYNTPKNMVYTATVKIRVDTIQAVSSVRGYITGMARGDYLATRTGTEELATIYIDTWKVTHDAGDYNKGYLIGTFSCFGLPQQYLSEKDPKNNHLVVKILCVDGTTIMVNAFDVGDVITQDDSELHLDVEVKTITLPNVKPEGGQPSGFDATIEDWGDTTNVVVPT